MIKKVRSYQINNGEDVNNSVPGMPPQTENDETQENFPIQPDQNYPIEPIQPEGEITASPSSPKEGGPISSAEDYHMPSISPEGRSPIPPAENYPVPAVPEGGKPIPPPDSGPGPVIIPVTGGISQVRFLHAAVNYGSLTISIGSRIYANNLPYSGISAYGRVIDGFRTVTIVSSQTPGGLLLRTTIPFTAGTKITFAIVNSVSGLDLIRISDEGCQNRLRNMGCFRAANLSYNSTPIDVLQNDGTIVFSDVRFKEVTPFKMAVQGDYDFFITETPRRFRPMPLAIDIIEGNENRNRRTPEYEFDDYLISFFLSIQAGNLYTAYLIGNEGFVPSLQILLVENA